MRIGTDRSAMGQIRMNQILRTARARASAKSGGAATTYTKDQLYGNSHSLKQSGSKKTSDAGKWDSLLLSNANKGEVSNKTAKELSLENKYLNTVKTAATDLRKRANNLARTNITSYFGQAEANKNKDQVLSEIKVFLSDYNTMLENTKQAGSDTMEQIRKECMSCADAAKDDFAKVGIHQNKDGSLTTAKQILESASIPDLEKVFSGEDSFAGKIFQKSILVESSAIASINKNKHAIPKGASNKQQNNSVDLQNRIRQFIRNMK